MEIKNRWNPETVRESETPLKIQMAGPHDTEWWVRCHAKFFIIVSDSLVFSQIFSPRNKYIFFYLKFCKVTYGKFLFLFFWCILTFFAFGFCFVWNNESSIHQSTIQTGSFCPFGKFLCLLIPVLEILVSGLLGKLEFYHLLSWFSCDENLKRTHQKD